jgi:hypothetical protein
MAGRDQELPELGTKRQISATKHRFAAADGGDPHRAERAGSAKGYAAIRSG